jgi:hypothetical protein
VAAEGLLNTEIGRRVGMTRQTVLVWRARYEAVGSTRWPHDLGDSVKLQFCAKQTVITLSFK